MTKYQVLGGAYTQDGKTYPKGSVVVSVHPLDEMFVNSFLKLGGVAEAEAVEAKAEVVQVETKKTLGREVTKIFPFVKGEGFKVYTQEHLFWIYPEDDVTDAINDEGLPRDGVENALREYLGL